MSIIVSSEKLIRGTLGLMKTRCQLSSVQGSWWWAKQPLDSNWCGSGSVYNWSHKGCMIEMALHGTALTIIGNYMAYIMPAGDKQPLACNAYLGITTLSPIACMEGNINMWGCTPVG